MARKVIIDCDMGTDDAVALSMALFDPRLDILAITATEGCVTAEQSTRNLQAIIEILDPDRYPRLGAAHPCENAPAVNTSYLYGADGLGNSSFHISKLAHMPESDKLMIDCVRAHPGDVTILCLGPLTNVARAFKRDPNIVESVDRIIMVGGSINGVGNITQAAEFNFYFDPESAQEVLCSRTTKSMVPLDVTGDVSFGLELLDDIPDESTRVGNFLKQILPYAYRAYRRELGCESINLNDAVGMLALLEPYLFEFEDMAAQVETAGELTRGATVFDRRIHKEWRSNVEVASGIRTEVAKQCIIDQVQCAGNAT